MSNKVVFKATGMQFKNGCLLIPCTSADKMTLNSFCESAGNRVITVTANFARNYKSYDQCKTVFALINIYFYLIAGRYPTSNEQALTYSKLLWKYAPRTTDPLNPDETVPVPLSQMTKTEAAIFINSIMGEIYEHQHGLTEAMEIDLKQIFEEFYSENANGNKNPVDYDEDGNLLTAEEWRAKNNFSFASFINPGNLHLHHIITRGARKDLIDTPWNWLMLTPEEHNIYHTKGWDYFLELFPHLVKRVKYAFDEGGMLYPLDLQKAFERLNVDISLPQNTSVTQKVVKSTEDLATEALAESLGGALF